MVLRPAFVKGSAVGDYADELKDEARTSKKDVLQNQITFAVSIQRKRYTVLEIAAGVGELFRKSV